MTRNGSKSPIYRAALIGCGRIGADCGPEASGSSRIFSHAQAYKDHPRVNLIAAYDIDVDALTRCGEQWKIPGLYTDLQQMMFNEHINLISISTPPETHVTIIEELIDNCGDLAGILLEKPVSLTLEEADIISDLVAKTKIKLAVNYIRRYPPVYRHAVKTIKQGELGRIQHVNIYYTKGIQNNGSHAFDLLRYMFGEPMDVRVLSSPFDTRPFDPTLNLRVIFPTDFEAWFSAVDHREHTIFEIDILGSEGRIIFRDQGHILDRFSVVDTNLEHGFRQFNSQPSLQSTDLSRAIYYAVDDLICSIESNTNPTCTLNDGRKALELSLQALEQAEAML